MDPVAKFGEPVRISPLIRFSRWSFLILGITYGASRNRFLQRRADKYKLTRDQRKKERLAREAEEKKRHELQNIVDLEKVIGVKIQ